ncbi:pre-B-cell leukemia transcription factor 3 isoform X4 [Dasypus novemcinctus]|uniref:pre-B-cell leukemia transcription factor 3 isoform X4 n=1 Tax=Dasypus novemcinctus TaxID=9361 RepID=UPI00265DE9D7|nr:pre-B-cell leukemia transcription factor 3 isoform X4 [Dasypus novemcinctus]XP_058158349.1 pre-B-cell leukemia transcription factor 3 isoform X4 [Dasypus novemcinctus]XP_058158350.1 pre-B-cell leukemia transcription factor 3 isoform X4 [Dasypus novemcinctus]
MSVRAASGGGACGRAPPPSPPLPQGAWAAVSEWHWQPVNPSAERPSSPVRGGCWLGSLLRQWRRRLLPPHQSAARPARGPPGPSIRRLSLTAPARPPAPKLSSSAPFAPLGPPAGLLSAAARRRRSLPPGRRGADPARPRRRRRRRPREGSAQAGVGGGGRPSNLARAEKQVVRGRPAGRAATRKLRRGRVRAADSSASASATAAEPGASARRLVPASAVAEAGAGRRSAPPQLRAPPAGPPPPRAGGERAAAPPPPPPLSSPPSPPPPPPPPPPQPSPQPPPPPAPARAWRDGRSIQDAADSGRGEPGRALGAGGHGPAASPARPRRGGRRRQEAGHRRHPPPDHDHHRPEPGRGASKETCPELSQNEARALQRSV